MQTPLLVAPSRRVANLMLESGELDPIHTATRFLFFFDTPHRFTFVILPGLDLSLRPRRQRRSAFESCATSCCQPQPALSSSLIPSLTVAGHFLCLLSHSVRTAYAIDPVTKMRWPQCIPRGGPLPKPPSCQFRGKPHRGTPTHPAADRRTQQSRAKRMVTKCDLAKHMRMQTSTKQ